MKRIYLLIFIFFIMCPASFAQWDRTGGGSGTIDTTGTVNANEVAIFNDSDTLKALTESEFKSLFNIEAGTDFLAPDGDGSSLTGIVTGITAGDGIRVDNPDTATPDIHIDYDENTTDLEGTPIDPADVIAYMNSDDSDDIAKGLVSDLPFQTCPSEGCFEDGDKTIVDTAATTVTMSTVTTDANPYTLTPTPSYNIVIVPLDNANADNNAILMSEIGAATNETVYIVNTNSNTATFSDESGQQKVDGGYLELEQNNVAIATYNSAQSIWYIGPLIVDNLLLSPPPIISGDPDSLDDTLATNGTYLYYGGTIIYNAAGEATLDAFTLVGQTVAIEFYPSVAIIVNPDSGQTITLRGVALAQGEALINSSNYGMCVLTYIAENSIQAVCSANITEETP
jgi:hypothetical protein